MSRRGSFRSFFGGSSKEKTEKTKVRLGKDFFADWEELDREEIQEHEQLKQLEEFVRKGMITQEVYEKLVRESKEKRLGLFKKREVKEKWEEKPIIQGYLYHRVQYKTRFKWKKFHFTLYRARLVWRKRKDSEKIAGSLRINKNFCLEELETIGKGNLPISKQGSHETTRTNKHSMRFAFKLTCFGDSWEFSAESEALKRYWFHTLGLQISRIIERALLVDKPLLLSTRPKLQTMPDNVAQSVRDYNFMQSAKNMSVRSLQRDRLQSNVSQEHTSAYFPMKDIDNETSVSKTKNTKVRKIMYLPKEAVLKNPSLIEGNDDDMSVENNSIPIFEVGEEVVLSPKEKHQSKHEKEEIHDVEVDTKSRMEATNSQVGLKKKDTVSEKVVSKFDLKARSSSSDGGLEALLEKLHKQLSLQNKKIKSLTSAFEIVLFQKQMMKEDLVTAQENPEDVEALKKAEYEYNRAKEMAISQEELLAAASLKKEQLKDLITKKEKQLAKRQLNKELAVKAGKEANSNVQELAEGIFLQTVKKEEVIAQKTAKARQDAKIARQKEINCQNNLERAMELKEHALSSDSDELFAKAELLYKQAKEELNLAEIDRKEKEAIWAEAVEEGINVRMKAIEIKKALKPKKKQETLPKKYKRRELKSHKSIHALANFMADNVDALSLPESVKKKPSKLQAFVAQEANSQEDEKVAPPPPDNYDDYSESFYTDEGYAHLKEDDLNFEEFHETDKYFQDKTKGISASAKDILSKRFMSQEIERLCNVISDIGKDDDNGMKCVSFGRLQEEYKNISDGLNGILVKAKAEGRIDYEGNFLLKEDSGVIIYLTNSL